MPKKYITVNEIKVSKDEVIPPGTDLGDINPKDDEFKRLISRGAIRVEEVEEEEVEEEEGEQLEASSKKSAKK